MNVTEKNIECDELYEKQSFTDLKGVQFHVFNPVTIAREPDSERNTKTACTVLVDVMGRTTPVDVDLPDELDTLEKARKNFRPHVVERLKELEQHVREAMREQQQRVQAANAMPPVDDGNIVVPS